MRALDNETLTLYHIRDPLTSAGLGLDGYHGITSNFTRRRKQHLRFLDAGTHPNRKLQAEHDASEVGLQIFRFATGSRAEIEARERLLVPRPQHNLNQQTGGGSRRGISTEEAITIIAGGERKNATRERTARDTKNTPRSHVPSGSSAAGAAATGIAGAETTATGGIKAALAGASAGAAALGAALLTAGVGSAYVMSKTVLKDDEALLDSERCARRDGRTAAYVGGVASAAGTLLAVGAAGTGGLSGAGIVSGVTAIGGALGGSGFVGAVAITAAPVVVAAAVGYGIYRLSRFLRKLWRS